uniref:RNase NYN domain-containing protein n=1 Tax=Panagrolaimus sp. ES5 TaxID=591445 RepID=A0AC34G8D0_9BILA
MSLPKQDLRQPGKGDCFEFATSLKKNELRRLILIDGFNILHHFKNMSLQDSAMVDDKMCPLILVPLVCSLMKEGFVVRIVLKNIPEENRISDSYVLQALISAGLCIFPLHYDVEEEDDLVLLKMAKQYGALIITRDQFRNHKEYQETAKQYVVEYDKVATGLLKDRFSSKQLETNLCYKYSISVHEFAERFVVDPTCEDYELVEKASKKFKQINEGQYITMKLINMYIYALFCYIFNRGIPAAVEDFIHKGSFPMSYDDFLFAYDADVEYKRKHQILQIKVDEEDDISDDDLKFSDMCLENTV